MRPQAQTSAPAAPRVELLLRLADGSPWRLSVSPGVERFIGHYPRLPGFEGESGLLAYRSVASAA